MPKTPPSAMMLTVALAVVGGLLPAHAQPVAGHPATQAPATKKTKVHRSSRIIMRPKAGAKIRTHDMRIKIRAKDGIARVRLNKTRLTRSDLVWRKGPYYTLAASSSHGLKHRRNVLTVVVRNGKGGLKKQRVTFRVTHKKPLTGAGRDATVRAGSMVSLPGRVRLHPDAKRVKNGATVQPTLTWKVVRAPGRDPALADDSGRMAQLPTQRPGRYVVKAVGSSGGLKTNDTVTIDAVPAPMLELDTLASVSNGPGIKIGQVVYPAYGPLDKAQWQVVILDRHTGAVQPGFNFTYGTCPDDAQATCRWNKDGQANRSPQQDLAGLDSTEMVVAAHHPAFAGGFGQAADYFASIGVPKGFSPSGPTSLIGLPAWDPGEAWRAVNSSRGLKGSLQWDTNKNFSFVSGDRTGFDTRSGGGCGPDTCTVTMVVGGEPKTYSVPKSAGGFAVQAYDRTTMTFIDGKAFNLTGAPAAVSDQVTAMISFIRQLPANAMVMVSSVGGPDSPRMGVPGLASKYTRSCWLSVFCSDNLNILGQRVVADLTDTIADLGGTRHAFLQSTRTPGDNYALVGWRGLGETGGSEVHSKTGRLTGAFVRGNDNRFGTANITRDAAAQELLTTVVGMTPKPAAWPGAGDSQYQAALDDIGRRIGIGADPRSAFWTRNEALDNGNPRYWIDRAKDAAALTGPAPGIDLGTWQKAQAELAQELVWVGSVRQYFVWLKHPYQAGNQLSAWIKATNVATTLRTSDDYAKSQKVDIDWLSIFSTLIEAVAPWAGLAREAVEKAVYIIAGLTAAALEYAAMGMANKENGEQITQKDEQEVKALEVQTEVVDRMQQTSDSFDRMADIVVSDYPKLAELGALTACNVENRPCQPGFETMSNDTFDRMSVSAQRTAEQTVFKKLLPIAWPVNTIPTGGKLSGDGYPEGNWDAKRYECYSASLFDDLPDRANVFTLNAPKYRLSDYGSFNPFTTPQFQVFVIGEINSRNNVVTPSDTTKGDKQILGRMFQPMSSSFDVSDGGLGIDPAEYMAEVQREKRTQDYDLTCGGWDYSDNPKPAPVN